MRRTVGSCLTLSRSCHLGGGEGGGGAQALMILEELLGRSRRKTGDAAVRRGNLEINLINAVVVGIEDLWCHRPNPETDLVWGMLHDMARPKPEQRPAPPDIVLSSWMVGPNPKSIRTIRQFGHLHHSESSRKTTEQPQVLRRVLHRLPRVAPMPRRLATAKPDRGAPNGSRLTEVNSR